MTNNETLTRIKSILDKIEFELGGFDELTAEDWSKLWTRNQEEWWRLDNYKLTLLKEKRKLNSALHTIYNLDNIEKSVDNG